MAHPTPHIPPLYHCSKHCLYPLPYLAVLCPRTHFPPCLSGTDTSLPSMAQSLDRSCGSGWILQGWCRKRGVFTCDKRKKGGGLILDSQAFFGITRSVFNFFFFSFLYMSIFWLGNIKTLKHPRKMKETGTSS